jgi:hypothetical protein
MLSPRGLLYCTGGRGRRGRCGERPWEARWGDLAAAGGESAPRVALKGSQGEGWRWHPGDLRPVGQNAEVG